MNSYKITYIVGEGETEETYITERTEAAARKLFKKASGGREITDVELYDTDAPATKDQERETLEKIKAMVAELGPQSYLATAFEGCFADAESNIENDFGDSMKARWLHTDAQLNAANGTIEELKEQLEESKKDWEAAHAAAHAIAEEKDAEIAALRERAISPDDLTDAIQLVAEKQFALEAEVKEAAQQIVDTATEPESANFQNAVNQHRAAKSQLDYYTALLERLAMVANG